MLTKSEGKNSQEKWKEVKYSIITSQLYFLLNNSVKIIKEVTLSLQDKSQSNLMMRP